jgi:signal transduction histidine kinase
VKPSDLGGDVAIEITHQVVEPLRGLRDRLGLIVDHIERHVATSTGPTPYPWRSLTTLRQDLAAAYLEATQLARRLEELDRAVTPPGVEPSWFDLPAAVDLGLRLAGHHLSAGIELLFDLGNVPPVRGVSGTLSLIVAQIVAISARSAAAVAGSTLSVRVSHEDDWGVVTIADNGGGDAQAESIGELARTILEWWIGSIDAASAEGQGCAFELRLATQPDQRPAV